MSPFWCKPFLIGGETLTNLFLINSSVCWVVNGFPMFVRILCFMSCSFKWGEETPLIDFANDWIEKPFINVWEGDTPPKGCCERIDPNVAGGEDTLTGLTSIPGSLFVGGSFILYNGRQCNCSLGSLAYSSWLIPCLRIVTTYNTIIELSWINYNYGWENLFQYSIIIILQWLLLHQACCVCHNDYVHRSPYNKSYQRRVSLLRFQDDILGHCSECWLDFHMPEALSI